MKYYQMKQDENETENEFANLLRNETLHFSNIFDEENLGQIFIDRLNKSIHPSFTVLAVETRTYRF